MAPTVMLIHGAWLTPSSWDRFRQRFEAAGVSVVAPPWPYLDRPVDELRRAPDPRLGKLGLRQITDHYATLIEAMPHPPILMGHSFGGLIVQLLADRGLGAAAVAIDPTPPFGVPAHPLAVWTSLCVFTAFNGWNRALRMSEREFASGFAQTLPAAEKPYAWEKFIVPTPGRVFFQAVLGIGARVRWDNPDRPPLMLIAGAKDRTVPAPMVRANYRKHLRSPVDTVFHEFPGRSHWLCNEDGWEEVADRALSWARTAAGR
ncbi:pimeloyl-ACP methyl ester carboxylesterase [Sphingomonas kyeonggiensis]|uniref:Pimeloyl-ACP methyl ester carboxylesterase n=1 Tax=Sphingomonas kyeonggiensis TaxID=1268553 RepID=A0A7W7NS99_9SPHN|nr:alpha/beta fold hydrolase [Sphingomonas kyeonggiensis]MBB4838576.1 pimeloyl-ACP methyl ester carboxylesterase [Sphingomonas kyeonggiensis]